MINFNLANNSVNMELFENDAQLFFIKVFQQNKYKEKAFYGSAGICQQ